MINLGYHLIDFTKKVIVDAMRYGDSVKAVELVRKRILDRAVWAFLGL